MIKLLKTNAEQFYSETEYNEIKKKALMAYEHLISKTGLGSDFLGWLDLPTKITESEIEKIIDISTNIIEKSEVVVVVGIGGSYLGSRAVIDSLTHSFKFLNYKKGNPLVLYAGHNISGDYLHDLLEILESKDYSIIVISKSGTTTEPAIAFRILKEHCENKYGKKEASERIVSITDKEKGALKKLSDTENYPSFAIPDDVGGRFSVLTAVGLLPISISGIDIRELIKGASDMQTTCTSYNKNLDNPAIEYAILRNIFYRKGYKIELMVNYLPDLVYFSEWWKQLYGESEGKDKKGIFPASVTNSSDLHSMGQYIQDGERKLFETMLWVENPKKKITIPFDKSNVDGLNFLSNKTYHEINKMAFLGTTFAHNDGGVPVIKIKLDKLDAYNLGQLIYFFEFACAISGYIIEVNPFDQPGVEEYKKNMFALLEKPGYEDLTIKIKKRLN